MMYIVGVLISVGLGVWTFVADRALRHDGVDVGLLPPFGWGIVVALVPMLGIIYLALRWRANQRATLGE